MQFVLQDFNRARHTILHCPKIAISGGDSTGMVRVPCPVHVLQPMGGVNPIGAQGIGKGNILWIIVQSKHLGFHISPLVLVATVVTNLIPNLGTCFRRIIELEGRQQLRPKKSLRLARRILRIVIQGTEHRPFVGRVGNSSGRHGRSILVVGNIVEHSPHASVG